jgi:hypothetical protein
LKRRRKGKESKGKGKRFNAEKRRGDTEGTESLGDTDGPESKD